MKITKCLKCPTLGHNSVNCKAEAESCDWCAATGHNKNNCPNKDKKPNCRNCGKDYTSGHRSCTGQEKAIRRLVSRTNYGPPDAKRPNIMKIVQHNEHMNGQELVAELADYCRKGKHRHNPSPGPSADQIEDSLLYEGKNLSLGLSRRSNNCSE